MRAVLYARVSSDDRGRDGRNLRGQLEMCRDYAESKGWQVVAELAEDDRGASGASFDLPQLNKALEMARAGSFDVLITRELDRLARGLAKQLVIEEEFRRAGVTLDYVLGTYEDTPEGALMKNVRAVVAEYERLKINERMTRGRRNKVRAGNVMTHGPAPYGYRRVETDGRAMLEVVEEHARVVRLIYEWYAGPEPITLREIVRRLSEMKIPTPADTKAHRRVKKQKAFGQWSKSTLHVILKSETYAGTWHYGKVGSAGANEQEHLLSVEVPAIVSRGLWQAAQRRRVANLQAAKRNTKYDYLLRRRVKCGLCRRKMGAHGYTDRGKLRLYYRCDARANPTSYGEPCTQRHFRAPDVDATAWQWLSETIANPGELTRKLKAYQQLQEQENAPRTRRLAVINDLLAENRAALERLLDLYLAGDYSREQLLDRKVRLERTIAELDEERRECEAELLAHTLTDEQIQDIGAFAAEMALGLEEADEDFETRRRLVEAVNLEAVLEWDGDRAYINASCILGRERLSIASNSTRSAGRVAAGRRAAAG